MGDIIVTIIGEITFIRNTCFWLNVNIDDINIIKIIVRVPAPLMSEVIVNVLIVGSHSKNSLVSVLHNFSGNASNIHVIPVGKNCTAGIAEFRHHA